MARLLALLGSLTLTLSYPSLRPPCTPLSVVSPYQSTWSCADNLFDAFPKHWAGATVGMSCMASIDGGVYRLMGPPGLSSTDLPTPSQMALKVTPTSSSYTFHTPTVELNVTFITPSFELDDDTTKMKDLPITYLTFSSISLDEAQHDVKIYFDTSAEAAVKDVVEQVEMSRSSTPASTTLSVGTTSQNYLSSNDDRINWGYQHVSILNTDSLSTALSSDMSSRNSFASSLPLPADDSTLIRACSDNWPVLAISFSLPPVNPSSPSSSFLLLSYDEVQTMDYFGSVLEPFWKSIFPSTEDMITYALENYEEAISTSLSYDESHTSALSEVGGTKYAELLSLVHRQVTGGLAKTLSPDKTETWMWMKEISSDGDISTVDVIYPAAPFFLYTSPETLRRMFLPLLLYSYNATGASPDYEYDFSWAPHHLGVWPTCDILAKDQEQMPVEESGNFLIMIAAVAKQQNGDVAYLEKYWDLLETWADYNVRSLPDPGEQLCTDDFEGASPHNVNLAAKGIVGTGAYALLLSMKGDKDGAEKYMNVAKDLVGNWSASGMDVDGTHTRLQYDLDDTWSMKYNLLFDRVLSLDLFDTSVIESDLSYYDAHVNEYGVPLDSRASFSKSDWLMWMYALGTDEQFSAQVDKLWKFADETESRVPLSDWFDTVTGKQQGFQARPVQGGMYARMLIKK